MRTLVSILSRVCLWACCLVACTGTVRMPDLEGVPRATAQSESRDSRATAGQDAPTVAFLAPDMLGCPTDRSVTLNVLPAQPLQVYVEYGAVSGSYTRRTEPLFVAAAQPAEITLDGLPPNAITFYRVQYRTADAAAYAAGEERSFTMQRAPGATFTFDVQGDSHPERVNKQFDAELYARTLAGAAADRPDFYFTIGDDFSVDSLKAVNREAVAQLYVAQRAWLGTVGAPVFLVNGNHEQAALVNLNGTPDNVAVWARTARNAYYPQPAPDGFYTVDVDVVADVGLLRDYYAFTWGEALFVVIDPYWHSPVAVDNPFGGRSKTQRDPWDVTLDETQYRWFKQTLETSTARYKFVFAHHVNGTGRGGIELAHTFEWGDAAGFAAHRPGWDQPIHQLMAQKHVTIFFQGHDHIFVRQELDGVIYQTLPEPADPNYTLENAAAYTSGDKLPNGGRVRVTVSPEQVNVEYVRSFLPADEKDGHVNGEVAYSYGVRGTLPAPDPTRRVLLPVVSGERATTTLPGNLVLGHPTTGSITASILTSADVAAYIEYGTAPGAYTGQTAVTELRAGQPAEIVVAGLPAATSVFYRLRFRVPGNDRFASGEEQQFQTQRAPGSAFTFTVDADPHNRDPNFNPEVYSATLRSIVADNPDFHIDLGDTFMAEKLAPTSYTQVEPTYREMRSFYGLLAGSVPLFFVNGNHDGEWGQLGGAGANLAAWATRARQTFYPNPTPGGFYSGSSTAEPGIGVRDGYYAWTWGDALFVVLDPYWYSTRVKTGDNWGLTLGQAQYEWLKRTLEASRARFKFVFCHNLVGGQDQNMRGGIEAADKYEWGGKNADGSWGFAEHRPGWPGPIHRLLVANNVTIVFHGHDHLFVKQDLDGIVYQEVPQPSYASYDKTDSAAQYGYTHGAVLGCCGYLRVAVAPEAVKVEYVRSYLPSHENAQRRSGQISYSYTVMAP